MSWFVYILQCSDGSYYTGHSEDPEARLRAHNSGKGPSYTAARRPVVLRYTESHPSREAAVQSERRLKRWSRAKKQALINGDTATLKEMSNAEMRQRDDPNELISLRHAMDLPSAWLTIPHGFEPQAWTPNSERIDAARSRVRR